MPPITDTAACERGRGRHTFISDACTLPRTLVCSCVDMYARFLCSRGLHYSRKHMFLADRAGAIEPGATAAQRKQRRNWCCCRLAREALLRGRRGRTWRSTRFLFARWRESVEGTCAVNGECVRVQVCECFKKWNPQGGIFVRLDNEQSEQPSWVCEGDD